MAKSGPGQAAVTVQPSLFDMFYEEFLTQFMSAAADPNEISQAELQTKLREDFTRMKVPTIVLSHLRHYKDTMIKGRINMVSRHEM